MRSWEEMGFNKFNLIGTNDNGVTTFWKQSAVLNWTECDILDQINARTGDLYTMGPLSLPRP